MGRVYEGEAADRVVERLRAAVRARPFLITPQNKDKPGLIGNYKPAGTDQVRV